VWQGSDKDEEGRAVREGACDTAFVFCALSQVNEEIKKYRKKEGACDIAFVVCVL
jgi:hypothetical protein